jgi:penicillin-binding protein 2
MYRRGGSARDRFRRRAFILGAGKALVLLGIGARLHYLQAVKSDVYRTMSDNNRIKRRFIPPPRGRILDRSGVVLAENRLGYRLAMDDEGLEGADLDLLHAELSALLEPDEPQRTALMKALRAPPNTNVPGFAGERKSRVLLENITWRQAASVEVRRPELKTVYAQAVYRRHFPLRAVCGHLTGYVGVPTKEDVEADPELRIEGMQKGKDGAEKSFDRYLRGRAGARYFEVNVKSHPVRELSDLPGVPGKDIALALDVRLQSYIEREMEGKSGSVVVVDVDTGGLLAYVSSPGFDPNAFTGGIGQQAWGALMNDPGKPLLNRPAASRYPPGSTFKPAVALAALASRVAPEHTVFCPGYLQVGDTLFHCWHPYGHGTMDMRSAIRQSCNVYFYHTGRLIGADAIARTASLLGFGGVTGVSLGQENPGLLPGPAWKTKKYGHAWTQGDTANMAIGQGYMQATPLQLAVMIARIASGRRLTPRMAKDGFYEPHIPPVAPPLGIPEAHLMTVRAALEDVVNDPRGTARAHALKNRAFSFAGKTGTVQVISKQQRKRLEASGDGAMLKRTEHHGLFVGYAPLARPKAAFSVMVEHGGSGGKAAAPVAKKIAEKVLELYFDGVHA